MSLATALVSSRPHAVVTLVEARLIELLGRRNVHQVPDRHAPTLATIGERWVLTPFGGGVTRQQIAESLAGGASVGVLSRPIDDGAIVLAAVTPDGHVDLVLRGRTNDTATLIGLADPTG